MAGPETALMTIYAGLISGFILVNLTLTIQNRRKVNDLHRVICPAEYHRSAPEEVDTDPPPEEVIEDGRR